MTNADQAARAGEPPLPDAVAALVDGQITEETVEALRRRYVETPLDASRSGELFAIAARVGDRGGPAFQAFLRDAMARVLMHGFSPFSRR